MVNIEMANTLNMAACRHTAILCKIQRTTEISMQLRWHDVEQHSIIRCERGVAADMLAIVLSQPPRTTRLMFTLAPRAQPISYMEVYTIVPSKSGAPLKVLDHLMSISLLPPIPIAPHAWQVLPTP